MGTQEGPVGLHLIESGRHRLWLAAPTLWSAAAHATLVASLVAVAPSSTGEAAFGETKDVVFFLPLLPKAAPAEGVTELHWAGEGTGLGPGAKSLPEDPRGFAPAV